MPSSIVTYAIFSLLIILNQYRVTRHVKATMIRGDLIFLIAFFIIHLLWPILILLFDVDYRYSDETVLNYLSKLSFYGIMAFSMGFLLISSKKRRGQKLYSERFLDIYGKNIDVLLLILLVTFYISAGEGYFLGEIYEKGGSSDTISGLSGYLYSLIIVLFFLRITIAIRIPDFIRSKRLNLFKILLGSFFITSIFSGDRGAVLSILLALFAFLPMFKMKFSRVKLLAGTIGFILLMGLIRIWRTTVLSYTNMTDLFFSTFINLADSFRVFFYANEIITTEGVYGGLTWLGPITGTIPFLQGTLVRMNFLSIETLNSPNVFTLYRHKTLNITGEGSTIAADLLLNFGHFGVVLGMLVIGMIFKKAILVNPFRKSIVTSFSALVLIAFCVYITRSSILYPLKYILWGILVHFLLFIISSLRTNE